MNKNQWYRNLVQIQSIEIQLSLLEPYQGIKDSDADNDYVVLTKDFEVEHYALLCSQLEAIETSQILFN